jgi:WD40 repeat protein
MEEKKEFLSKMKIKTGQISSILWTSDNSFCLTDKLGIFSLYDTRYSLKPKSPIQKRNSTLKKIKISAFCKENNLLAFGGNSSKVLLFDIRNVSKSCRKFENLCSKIL